MGRLLASRCSFRRSRIFDDDTEGNEGAGGGEERTGGKGGVHIDVERVHGTRCVGYQWQVVFRLRDAP